MHDIVDAVATNDKPENAKQARHGKGAKQAKAENVSGGNEAKPVQACKQKCAFMYVGPNAPMENLFTGSLYKDSLPEMFEEKFSKLPELKKLFIDVASLPAVKKEVAEQGTKMYSLFQYVETKLQEGVLKNGV